MGISYPSLSSPFAVSPDVSSCFSVTVTHRLCLSVSPWFLGLGTLTRLLSFCASHIQLPSVTSSGWGTSQWAGFPGKGGGFVGVGGSGETVIALASSDAIGLPRPGPPWSSPPPPCPPPPSLSSSTLHSSHSLSPSPQNQLDSPCFNLIAGAWAQTQRPSS